MIKNTNTTSKRLTATELDEMKFNVTLRIHTDDFSPSSRIEGSRIIRTETDAKNCVELLKVAQSKGFEGKVKQTMALFETVLQGEAKSIDYREISEISDMVSDCYHELVFIEGLVKLFKYNKDATSLESYFIGIKQTILDKYSDAISQNSDLEGAFEQHQQALEAIVKQASINKASDTSRPALIILLLLIFIAIHLSLY